MWVHFFFEQVRAFYLFQSWNPVSSLSLEPMLKMFPDRLLLLQLRLEFLATRGRLYCMDFHCRNRMI